MRFLRQQKTSDSSTGPRSNRTLVKQAILGVHFESLESRRHLAGDGLRGEYYDNTDFTDLKLTRVDSVVSFPWWQTAPATSMGVDNFSVRWTGMVEAPTTGSYTFWTWSCDGARLWINDNLVIDVWTTHMPRRDAASPITLQAGQKYNVGLEYYSGTNSAEIALGWRTPGSSTDAIVPQTALYAAVDDVAPSTPSGLTSSGQTSSTINLNWPASTDNVAVSGYDIYRNGTRAGTSVTPSFVDTALAAGTAYSYTVMAFDAAGNYSPASAPLVVSTIAPDTIAPTQPAGLFASGTTYTGVTLGWTASTDNVAVTRYDVLRNGAKVGSATGTSFSDTGLVTGTAYTYTVVAFDASANASPASVALVATTLSDTQAPSTPQGLIFSSRTNSSVSLAWTASSDNVGVTRYDVFRDGSKVGSATGTTYSDTGLTASTPYLYTVAAVDAAGNLSATSTTLSVATTATAVQNGLRGEYYDNTDFTDLRLTRVDPVVSFPWWQTAPATSMGVDNFSVRWTGMVEAPTTGSYTFWTWSCDGARLWINDNLVIDVWTTHMPQRDAASPITLQAGQSYKVRLDYFSGTNSAEIALGWRLPGSSSDAIIPTNRLTSEYADTVAPTVPQYPAATVKTDDSVLVSWARSTDDIGVTEYEVYRNGLLVGSTTGTSLRDVGLSASTSYSYVVRAKDASGNTSAGSTPLAAVTAAVGTKTLYEAETATLSGATVVGSAVTSLGTNDYLRFSGVDLGASTPTFEAYVSVLKSQVGGSFEVRLDSPAGALAGTLVLQTTGVAGAPYVLQRTSLTGASGVRDIYIVAKNGSSIATLDWVRFSRTALTRVMAIGDSITQAPGGYAGYRYLLFKRLEASGIAVDFVGSQTAHYALGGMTDPANFDFDQNHEGHSGWRADEILAQIGSWAQTYRPDIAMIHLGTNDIFQGQSNAGTTTEIGQIIDALRSVNPNIRIALAQIIPSTITASQTTNLNGRIAKLSAQKNTAMSPIRLVDQATGFSPTVDTYDGTHPNALGEAKMADRWLAALLQML